MKTKILAHTATQTRSTPLLSRCLIARCNQLIWACICTLMLVQAQAVTESAEFDTVQLKQRYSKLTHEFRCLVCQNQSIADSDADLAKDLRRKTAEMLRAGQSDAQIRRFMRDRYGDFVLYRTPFTSYTAFIWIAPFSALLLGIWFFFGRTRRRQSNQVDEDTVAPDALKQAKALLNSPRSENP